MAKGFGRAFVLLAVIFTSSGWVAAQVKEGEKESKEEPEFTLTFTDAKASKEGDAALPVLFTQRLGGPNVTEMRVRLTYLNSNLKYKSVELTEPARSAGLEVKAQESEATVDHGALEMAFSLSEPSRHNFPNGQLAIVNFRFADPAPGVSATLKAELWIDGKPVKGDKSVARVDDAYIEVPPIRVFLNCFFFTH